MKKIILSIIALLTVAGVNAQTWDFTNASNTDINNINADIEATTGSTDIEWKYDSSNNRYGNLKKHENAAIKANGTELEYTNGLLFTFGSSTGDGSFRIDVGKSRMWVSTCTITIPK